MRAGSYCDASCRRCRPSLVVSVPQGEGAPAGASASGNGVLWAQGLASNFKVKPPRSKQTLEFIEKARAKNEAMVKARKAAAAAHTAVPSTRPRRPRRHRKLTA